jgi:hypothetical protein
MSNLKSRLGIGTAKLFGEDSNSLNAYRVSMASIYSLALSWRNPVQSALGIITIIGYRRTPMSMDFCRFMPDRQASISCCQLEFSYEKLWLHYRVKRKSIVVSYKSLERRDENSSLELKTINTMKDFRSGVICDVIGQIMSNFMIRCIDATRWTSSCIDRSQWCRFSGRNTSRREAEGTEG